MFSKLEYKSCSPFQNGYRAMVVGDVATILLSWPSHDKLRCCETRFA